MIGHLIPGGGRRLTPRPVILDAGWRGGGRLMRIPESKVRVPDVPSGFAAREHLIEHLDSAGAGQLAVVIAPPGYGKTALLADWLHRPGGRPTAWVCLDATDDAARFRAALLAALAAIPDLAADSPLRALGRGGGAAGLDVVDELAEALDGAHRPIRVVLDDLHELAAPEAMRDLERLVRRRPAGLQLVLAGRSDPPLHLARLRLEGRLHETRAGDLRFSLADTATLLRSCGLELTAEQVAGLHARTEGWAAGLRFAALALRRTDDPQGFIAQFSGSERSVADYLAGEVMTSLPAQSRQLLRVASVCPELPVGLAAELSGRADAGRMLDELARGTALVQRTDPRTYRIHPLLRTYLVTDLQRHLPELHRRSHVTAAEWWLAADDPVRALRHAEAAGETTLLRALLRASGAPLVAAGRLDAVRRALDAAGAAAVAVDPWAALLAALVHHRAAELADASVALGQARRAARPPAGPPDPELEVLLAAVGLLVANERPPQAAPADPGPSVPAESRALAQLCHVGSRLSCVPARLSGDTSSGDGADPSDLAAQLEGVLALSRAGGFPYFEAWALSLLASVEAARGRYPAMTAAARSAVAVATRQGRDTGEWTAEAAALLAYGELLAGEPAAARSRAESVLAADGPGRAVLSPAAELALRVVQGAALGDLGEHAAGLAGCRAARSRFGDAVAPAPLLAALAVLEHRAALTLGGATGATTAAETAEWLERRVGKVGEVLLMDAWAHLHAGQHDAARWVVEPVEAGTVATLVAHTPVEARLVRAEAALRAGDDDTGRAELAAAVELAAALDVVRPLVLAPGLVGELLREAPPTGPGSRFAARLAGALSVVRAAVPAPLSERELAVLALLPSLLSAGEIADELTVSVNTVKSHIRSIYAKFGVSTRRAAIRRAHELSLFD